MKKIFLLPALIFVVAFTACGPAAENREQMMARSKVFQDSIAAALKASMDEAAAPGPGGNLPAAPASTAAATPSAQPAK
jgi:hypothetical protein